MATVSLFSAAARRLEGKVALITGGASGIGECTARLFSKHGAKLVIADVQDDLGLSVCKDLSADSSSYVHCDVAKEKDVENAVNTAVSEYGKLDIMFNNAGILDAAVPCIVDSEKSDFEKVIGVNLVGSFLGTKHAARVMIPRGSGSIISTASVSGSMGGLGTYAYICSKHGVIGLTKNAAVDLGRYGIRVNCVSPYAVPTAMSKGFLKVDEEAIAGLYSSLKGTALGEQDVAEAALYLASDESKYAANPPRNRTCGKCTTGVKNRLKEARSGLSTAKKLLKVLNQMCLQEQHSSRIPVILALGSELDWACNQDCSTDSRTELVRM